MVLTGTGVFCNACTRAWHSRVEDAPSDGMHSLELYVSGPPDSLGDITKPDPGDMIIA